MPTEGQYSQIHRVPKPVGAINRVQSVDMGIGPQRPTVYVVVIWYLFADRTDKLLFALAWRLQANA